MFFDAEMEWRACLLTSTQINSIPTLLAFSRGEAQIDTKVTRLEQLQDRQFLVQWLKIEAARRGQGGAGGGGLTGIFSSLFR